jgi:C1A family cysteine protease
VPFGTCVPNLQPITQISNYQQLPTTSPDAAQTAIKQCLTGIGPYAQSPVVTIFVLYRSFMEWSPPTDNQVYRYKDNDPFEKRLGGHAVCIVGYNDNPGYWICKNSFGTDWGFKGFVNFSYGDCHIDDFLMYGVAVP